MGRERPGREKCKWNGLGQAAAQPLKMFRAGRAAGHEKKRWQAGPGRDSRGERVSGRPVRGPKKQTKIGAGPRPMRLGFCVSETAQRNRPPIKVFHGPARIAAHDVGVLLFLLI